MSVYYRPRSHTFVSEKIMKKILLEYMLKNMQDI